MAVYGEIYKITNKVTGHCYVGQTVQGIQVRFQQHLYSSKYEYARRYSRIHKAIAKYGANNFEVKLVCLAGNADELTAREALAIRLFKPQYNIRAASSKGHLSEETRKKLSVAHTGKIRGPRSAEVIQKISQSNTGKKRSQETRRRLSLAHKGKVNEATQTPVVLIDLETGATFDFPSQTLAASILGVGRRTLNNAARNKKSVIAKRYRVV